MDYVHLGRTGLRVSRLCLGTVNFGPHTSEPDSHAMLDRALEHGLNFVDTANVYGGQKGEGISEQFIGRWLAQGGQRRERIVLATKVYSTMGWTVNQERLSAYHIRQACDDSLRRLKTDRIDLYQMHHVDRNTPWEEIWQAIEQLVQQGKVLYVGSSNFAGFHIAQAQGEAKARHFMGLVSEQCVYNLSKRMVEMEVLPACREFGLGVLPWSPLGSGLLSGILNNPQIGRRSEEIAQKALEEHRQQIEAYEALCAKIGQPPALVALAWLLKNPLVTAPIIGPRTVQQLDESMKALDIELTEETLQQLDTIWPGPGGESPEAFAW